MAVRILVVEDEMIVAEDLRRTLGQLGYEVCGIVASGEQVRHRVEVDQPDLILMDIGLKGSMDGIEAAADMNTRYAVPIIYLTAYTDPETLKRAKLTNPFGYIIKPFEKRDLRTTIEMALHKHQMEKKITHLNTILRAIRNVDRLITTEKDTAKLIQGICQNLVDNRGYDNVWIAITNPAGRIVTTAEADIKQQRTSASDVLTAALPVCVKQARTQRGVVVMSDATACASCDFVSAFRGKYVLCVRLESNQIIYGFMKAALPTGFIVDDDELALFQEVANDVAFNLYTIRMEQERARVERELRSSEHRLRKIINRTADGIIIVDRQGMVCFANPAAQGMFGLSEQELTGTIFGSPVTSEETTEISLVRVGVKPITAEMRTAEIQWEGKPAYLASLRDITDHKKIEQALQQSVEKSQRILQETVQALAIALEKRDPYTAGHSLRVAQLAEALAEELGLPEDQVRGAHIAAAIHDIGKIYVPAEILSKPRSLSEAEFNLIKSHPQIGFDILRDIEFPWPIAQTVLQHHERMNGSGYPRGLSAADIPLFAKILGVADVVEAMCSHRPYRPAPGLKRALEEIADNRGILYAPDVVDACSSIFSREGFSFSSEGDPHDGQYAHD
jgi:putative nucleotidyltransferase with HDIG domain